MSKMARFRQVSALLWGFIAWSTVLGGCCGNAKLGADARPPATTPAAPEAAPTPDYATKLAEWVQAHQPDPEAKNSWTEFADVVAQVRGAWDWFTHSDGQIARFIAQDPDNNYPAADPQAIVDKPEYARFIPELRAFFATFDKSELATRMDGLAEASRFVALRLVDEPATAELPELGHARLAGKLCMARAHLAAADGDWDLFARSIRRAGALSRGAQGRGFVMGGLVSGAIVSATDSRVRREILDGTLRAGHCVVVRAALAQCDPPDLPTMIGGERLAVLEQIEAYIDELDAEQAEHRAGEIGWSVRRKHPPATRADQLALANRIFDGWLSALSDDPLVSERARRDVEDAFGIARSREGKPYEPLNSLLPSVGQVTSWDKQGRAHHAATLAMLALEVYRAKEGRYPDALDALGADQIPADPYARAAPLRYRLLDAKSTDPNAAYILYSVGSDGMDDGGLAPARANNDATTPAGKGSDLILNRRD